MERDEAWRISTGQRMGSLELLDYIGLDIMLAVSDSLYEQTRDMVLHPPLLLRKIGAARTRRYASPKDKNKLKG